MPEVEAIEPRPPRRFRRWISKHARALAKGFAGIILAIAFAMYAWRAYLMFWPAVLPLAAANPAFFWLTVVFAAFATLSMVGVMSYGLLMPAPDEP